MDKNSHLGTAMRPLILWCTIHRHLSWKGLEKFEEGREQQDFSFELFWKFVLTQRVVLFFVFFS